MAEKLKSMTNSSASLLAGDKALKAQQVKAEPNSPGMRAELEDLSCGTHLFLFKPHAE